MGATKRWMRAGWWGVAALMACTSPKLDDEAPRQEAPDAASFGEAALKDATVTLFPGHCAGVIVADGHHALTAAHCLDGAPGTAQPVVLRDGRQLEGVVRLVDPAGDLAVIRFDEAAPVKPLALSPSMPLPGEELLFAGRNDRPGATQQVRLERLGRCPSLPGVPQALFTSLRGAKGDSGAPVVDRQLHVVGLVHGGAVCSIAAPTAALVPFLNTLVAELARSGPAPGVGGSGSAGQ